MQVIQNDVIKCCKMMSSNVALLHSNNCCVLEPAICEDLDLHVIIDIFIILIICDIPQCVLCLICVLTENGCAQELSAKMGNNLSKCKILVVVHIEAPWPRTYKTGHCDAL